MYTIISIICKQQKLFIYFFHSGRIKPGVHLQEEIKSHIFVLPH
ncbi:hypothetical protein HMPREF0766_13261 [Sphingobacterium spiritivorum ATCC 33861]|uniref:Uncharacterized protein n=1 Tax=Sphingobacterium spiritivorum ATCC 33861 TaxID=525373 RepID=D7VQK7_SPHSI|nr:hypothetical protein HMPREF0766_13261 [Sphingobacterium spiritivorum ATCC 33861]